MNLYDSVRGTKKVVLILGITVILAACANVSPTPAPTQPTTGTPNPTSTPAPTSTSNPTEPPLPTATFTSTETQTATPMPFVSLGSPFASDCGDGIPRIWSNDSFNGPANNVPSDDHHGHVDIFIPKGCDVSNYIGEVLAPISGIIKPETTSEHPNVYLLYPDTYYISGIEKALDFSGIKNSKISYIREIRLNMGHFHSAIDGANTAHGVHVEKGQSIGDITPTAGHQKLAYQIYVTYNDIDIALSPTLFDEGINWICVPNSPYDCKPQPNDYAP